MTFLVKHQTLGAHVRCRLFVSQGMNGNWIKSGDFVLLLREFQAFEKACKGLIFREEEKATTVEAAK